MPISVLLRRTTVPAPPPTASPSDVPGIYDLVINSNGYIFANAVDPNLPFRTQRAKFGFTPTFVERTNTSGDYGDNQQAFWLTVAQRDWSLGDGQKFFRSQDAEKSRQFWYGSNLNVSIPGQVSIARTTTSNTAGSACSGAIGYPASDLCFTASSTNLFEVSPTTVTDRSTHGLGSQPTAFATDGSFVYLSSGSASKVRRYDMGAHTFADFSAQPADSLVYLNNTLYGVKDNNFYSYDTAGNATNQFPWKTATGAALSGTMKVIAFGGKVIILRNSGTIAGSELWEFDGTGVAKLAEYPGNFLATSFCVCSGVLFVVGLEGKTGDGYRTAIWYYANGNIGRAYADPVYGTASMGCSITAFGSGLLFGDSRNSSLRFYDLSTGGVTVVKNSLSGSGTYLATAKSFAVFVNGSTTISTYPSSTTVNTTGTLQTSIVDFESSLTKLFRGVIVDYVADADATIDIYYQLDDVTGSWTLLEAAARSGIEYEFPNATTGRGIAIQVILRLNTGTVGPILKRVYVRAAPTLSQFRTGEYIVDCTGGPNGQTPVQLRNGQSMTLTGQQLANKLLADATSGELLSITDHISTYTGIVELENFDLVEINPQEYYARFTAREV